MRAKINYFIHIVISQTILTLVLQLNKQMIHQTNQRKERRKLINIKKKLQRHAVSVRKLKLLPKIYLLLLLKTTKHYKECKLLIIVNMVDEILLRILNLMCEKI